MASEDAECIWHRKMPMHMASEVAECIWPRKLPNAYGIFQCRMCMASEDAVCKLHQMVLNAN